MVRLAHARSATACDWPVSWEEMWRYYAEVEDALKISGPVSYPWGPKRGRYPYRPHEVNAPGLVLARGAEALGVKWAPCPIATLSAPRGEAHPCVYRGFCKAGCATNAKQSVLVTYIPRALAAGAEVRDLAIVTQIEMGPTGRAKQVVFHRQGRERRQRAQAHRRRRLLDRDAPAASSFGVPAASRRAGQFLRPRREGADGARQSCGLGDHGRGDPLVQGTAVDGGVRALELRRRGKDFHGGYSFMSQGPLPIDFATRSSPIPALSGWSCASACSSTITWPG